MDPKRDLRLLRTALKVGSLPRGLKIAQPYKRNNPGWVTQQPGTELRPVSFNKRQQNEEIFFPETCIHGVRLRLLPSFPYRKQSVFIFKMQIMLILHGSENPSMRALI